MAITYEIGVLPGMDPAMIASLNALSLYLTSDLLRTNRRGLVARVPSVNLAQLRTWQSASQFLEIDGVTPEMASAFCAAGIDSLRELTGRSLARLRPVLAGLGSPPTDDALLALLLDARTLELTGVINGTVVTSKGLPLAGAVVVAGGQRGETDARGRFRLQRLRLGVSVTVTITHPEKAPRSFRSVAAHPSSALVGRRFRLTGLPTPTLRLSALRGDRLPTLGSAPLTTEAQLTPPSDDDLLAVVDFYANGDARVASLFLDFAEGRFIVRTYRIASSLLPVGTAINDRLQPSAGSFSHTRASAKRVGRKTRVRAVIMALSEKPRTAALIDLAATQILEALTDP